MKKIYECINQGGKEPNDWNIELPLDLWQKFRIKIIIIVNVNIVNIEMFVITIIYV